MILVGNQRGGARDLALHLMKDENEHIDVHQLRGFASDNLMGALNEAYAISRGTRCKQFLYSLSFNPPPGAEVATADFEDAIERAEDRLGLSGQPRAIVFHEKDGRRHAHAVWSRIRAEEMKAVQLSFTHNKLQTLARELFIEHGWIMPRGFVNSKERDPRNFTLEEWQQAERIGQDLRAVKTAFQDAWAISDSKAAFIHAMQERGYKVARGDRKGRIVAVDVHGEVHSIPKRVGVPLKQVRARLGDEYSLPSVAEAKAQFAKDMLSVMQRFKDRLDAEAERTTAEFERSRKALVDRQRAEREDLNIKLKHRQQEAARQRQARFRPGVKGLWDRLRGEHKRIKEQNEREAAAALRRDRAEKDQLVFDQLAQRRMLKQRATVLQQQFRDQRQEIERDVSRFKEERTAELPTMRDRLDQLGRRDSGGHKRPRQRGPTIER